MKTLLHTKNMYISPLLQGRETPEIYVTGLPKQDEVSVVTFDWTIKQNHRLRSNSDIRLLTSNKSGHGTRINSVITFFWLNSTFPFVPGSKLLIRATEVPTYETYIRSPRNQYQLVTDTWRESGLHFPPHHVLNGTFVQAWAQLSGDKFSGCQHLHSLLQAAEIIKHLFLGILQDWRKGINTIQNHLPIQERCDILEGERRNRKVRSLFINSRNLFGDTGHHQNLIRVLGSCADVPIPLTSTPLILHMLLLIYIFHLTQYKLALFCSDFLEFPFTWNKKEIKVKLFLPMTKWNSRYSSLTATFLTLAN